MVTMSYWSLAAICLGLGAAAYGLGRWSAELRAERLRFAQLMILRQLSESGEVEVHVAREERKDE